MATQHNYTKTWLEAAYLYGVFTSDNDLARYCTNEPKHDWEDNARNRKFRYL